MPLPARWPPRKRQCHPDPDPNPHPDPDPDPDPNQVRAPVDVVMETIMREAMGLRLRSDGDGAAAEWVACEKEPG